MIENLCETNLNPRKIVILDFDVFKIKSLDGKICKIEVSEKSADFSSFLFEIIKDICSGKKINDEIIFKLDDERFIKITDISNFLTYLKYKLFFIEDENENIYVKLFLGGCEFLILTTQNISNVLNAILKLYKYDKNIFEKFDLKFISEKIKEKEIEFEFDKYKVKLVYDEDKEFFKLISFKKEYKGELEFVEYDFKNVFNKIVSFM